MISVENAFLQYLNIKFVIFFFKNLLNRFSVWQKQEKKEEIWLSPVTKTPTPTEQSKKQRDNIKTPPKARAPTPEIPHIT